MVISNQNKTSVYLPKEIFSHILSYNDNSLKRHKEKQSYINDFFDLLRENREMSIEQYETIFNCEIDDFSLNEELYEWIIEEMISYEKSQDISLYLLHN